MLVIYAGLRTLTEPFPGSYSNGELFLSTFSTKEALLTELWTFLFLGSFYFFRIFDVIMSENTIYLKSTKSRYI